MLPVSDECDCSCSYQYCAAHAGGEMEDGFVDSTDPHGTVLRSGRKKGDEALCHDIVLSVDPQLDLSAQAVDVVRVGADEAERFGKRVAVLLYRPFLAFGLRPVARPEPRCLHVKCAFENIAVQSEYSAGFLFRKYRAPRCIAHAGLQLRYDVFRVVALHERHFSFLTFSCPPGSASARVLAPIMIVNSRCGFVNFFQVSGPCFTPLGT